MIGACWVSETYLTANGLTAPSHEFQLVQYLDGEQQNRRFYGFQANVLQTQNHLSLVQLWHPGTGAGTAPPAGTWWLDSSAPTRIRARRRRRRTSPRRSTSTPRRRAGW